MPNYTKKRHRASRKKIGGVKKNKERSQSQSEYFTNWQPKYGEPGSIAADLRRWDIPRQPRLDPETSIADHLKRFWRNVTRDYRHYGNKISDSRTINAVRSLLRRTPPPATIVETIVETPLPPPPARPSNITASKTRINPSIAKQTKQTKRRSRISQILRRSQRSKP